MGKIVAANWKMNLRLETAGALASRLAGDGRECWLFPAFPHLAAVVAAAGGALKVGAQDVCSEVDGAFTGDVSAEMLLDAGCVMALIGHSERRNGHGETDELLGRKLMRALEAGLKPLYCVGETLVEREKGAEQAVVGRQLEALAAVGGRQEEIAAVAYEPVWAIGTGRVATTAQAAEMHRFVRERLGAIGLSGVRVLYGGSAKPENAAELLASPEIDGLLVGGASLSYESLSKIDEIARES